VVRSRATAAVVAGLAGLAACAPAAQATFPGGNGRIAFARALGAGQSEIFTVGPTGGPVTQLTHSPGIDTAPAWSPDGGRIAFSSDRAGDQDIYVMKADGTGVARVTNEPGIDTDPTWSPDGTRLAFASNRDGDMDIYVMNADGTGQLQLTHNSVITDPPTLIPAPGGGAMTVPGISWGADDHPAWAPGSDRIAFDTDRAPARTFEVYSIKADGTGEANLTHDSAAVDLQPSWSPDGTRLAIASSGADGDGVYLINAGGGGLTSRANPVSVDKFPAWSPDGTKIVYRSTFRPTPVGLYVMNADGTGEMKLTSGNDSEADWQVCPTCAVSAPLPPTPPLTETARTPAAAKSGATPLSSASALFGDPLAPVAPPMTRALRVRATPTRALPGDVIVVSVRIDGKPTRESVHLLGVTTRGLGRCAGKGRRALRRWLFDRRGRGRPVVLLSDPGAKSTDAGGRIYAYVGRRTAAELEAALLRKGLARLDRSPGAFKYLSRFGAAQARARVRRAGVWGRC
jgi:endonuclease YncB( thermonuclease family)